jgi:putative spermidine/putrescine transport system substrate-binding protein
MCEHPRKRKQMGKRCLGNSIASRLARQEPFMLKTHIGKPNTPLNPGLTRRDLLISGAGAVAASALLGAPAIAQTRSIKIGSYGGYFEDSFKQHVYPEFTKATGIEIESVSQPNSTDWLVTMQQGAKSGSVPADLSLYSKDTMIKASRIGELLKPLDTSKIPTVSNLGKDFVYSDSAGVLGVGAMAWFTSMVVNPNIVTSPESWADFWDTSKFESGLGISKLHTSNFLDITAATFFDGEETMMSNDGIIAIVEKVAELKPNVALWWDAESQMEQAMKNEDVIGGMYYHDVAGLMAADGFPIVSIFPKEGNPIGYGSWCLSTLSEKSAEAEEFMTFSCEPSTQALMSRKIGTAPLVPQDMTDLTDEEFVSVSGSPIIQPAYEAYLDNETFIKDTWEKMLASS